MSQQNQDLMENKLVVNRNIMFWAYEYNASPQVVSTFAGCVYNYDQYPEEFQKRYTKEYTIYFVGRKVIFESMRSLWDGVAYYFNCYDQPQIEKATKIPQNIHNLGVYISGFFENDNTLFHRVKTEHKFQTLTESNKPGISLRSAIYLGHVSETCVRDDGKLEKSFPLLRCSSNLGGPTDNFRETDYFILNAVNETCANLFEQKVNLNHVLAQVYNNSSGHKAKIKTHSDKTKDMPRNGVIAFVTFYDFPPNIQYKKVPGDVKYKNVSALTQLVFKAKKQSQELQQFSVILEPGSLFVIPLSTNRLYTHEIRPSILPANKIPTRLGYVIRCSKTTAIYSDSQTFVVDQQSHRHALQPPTTANINELRQKYWQENSTFDFIDYGDVYFSMNEGDYQEPIV
jgi:hypothetical protein